MIRYFCDSCGKEKETLNNVEVPCHYYSKFKDGLLGGYCDNEFNPISGRKDVIQLCNRCYNTFYKSALESVNLLGSKND